MLYDFSNPYDVDKAVEYLKGLVKSKAKCSITKKHEQRTLPQNNYYHLIVRYWATQYGCSESEAELDFFKREVNSDIFATDELRKDGRAKLRSSSSLNSAEMSLAIERFRNWSQSVAGIYIPSPDEREFQFRALQVIEQHKEFL